MIIKPSTSMRTYYFLSNVILPLDLSNAVTSNVAGLVLQISHNIPDIIFTLPCLFFSIQYSFTTYVHLSNNQHWCFRMVGYFFTDASEQNKI